jgi:hypothetical protein
MSSRQLAPNLYKQVSYKFRTVYKELQGFSWINNIKQINTEELMDEFVLIFTTPSKIHPIKAKYSIHWKWSRSGVYLAASTYDVQFLGEVPQLKASSVWQAKTESKCWFFTWLAILSKAPTADKLIKKNW